MKGLVSMDEKTFYSFNTDIQEWEANDEFPHKKNIEISTEIEGVAKLPGDILALALPEEHDERIAFVRNGEVLSSKVKVQQPLAVAGWDMGLVVAN